MGLAPTVLRPVPVPLSRRSAPARGRAPVGVPPEPVPSAIKRQNSRIESDTLFGPFRTRTARGVILGPFGVVRRIPGDPGIGQAR